MSKRLRRLRRLNQTAADSLFTEYRSALTRMEQHILAAPISAYQKEVVRQDVIQMLADGQARKTRPADIIGPDYDAFCESVLAEIPRPTAGEQALAVLGDLCSILSLSLLPILSQIAIAGLGVQEGAAWPMVDIPVSTAIAAGLMCYVMLCFFILLFRRPYVSSILSNRRALALCILGLWCDDVLDLFVGDVLRTVLFQLPATPVIALTVVFFGVYGLLYATLD